MRKVKRSEVALFLLLLTFSIGVNPAFAAITSQAKGSVAGTSGSWGAQLATASGAPSTSAYSIIWTSSTIKQYDLVAIVNTGSFDLASQRISVSSAKPNGDTNNPPTLVFDSCSGVWDPTTYACSGTVTTLATGTSGLVTLTHTIAPGSRAILRVTTTRPNAANYVTNLNAYVSRTDIRLGMVSHS